jgi:outer membrane lipoprotein-sorting protein
MMKAVIALRVVLVLVIASSVVSAQELTTAEVLSKMDEKAKAFKTLEASISRARVERGFRQPVESGKILMKVASSAAPRILLDITMPANLAKTVLISNGVGELLDRRANTYQTKKVDANSDVLQLLLIGFGVPSAQLAKDYKAQVKGREAVDGEQTVVLELTSASTRTEKYPKVTLWLDSKTWTPVQTRLEEPTKAYTDVKYSSVKLNQNIADSKFKISVPKDAQRQ